MMAKKKEVGPPVHSIEIDLSKGDKHSHPDIKADGTLYLCRIGGGWFMGAFDSQWFGLSFKGWLNPHGLQFDTPGTNSSKWERVIELHID
jgi:hypothetical protein